MRTYYRPAFVLVISLASLFIVLTLTRESKAFRGCNDVRDAASIYHCWPNYGVADRPAGQGPDGNGTKRWGFCYELGQQGFQLHDVTYNGISVAKKINLAYVLTRYAQPNNATSPSTNPTTCGGGQAGGMDGPAYDDTPIAGALNLPQAEMGCVHVPSTVCSLGTRSCDSSSSLCTNTTQTCASDADCIGQPGSGTLDPADCTGLCVPCEGVCAGTQVETNVAIEESGQGEVSTGGNAADLILTATTYSNGHQIVQRYRFKGDGTLVPSVRLGGTGSDLAWHQHIAHWQFDFNLPGASAGNDVIQRCDPGGSCAINGTGWTSRSCECATSAAGTEWRVFDPADTSAPGVPLHSVVIQGGPNDGTPNVCGSADKTYCAVRTDAMTNDGLVPSPVNCQDGLNDYAANTSCGNLAVGAPITFWYLAHATHNPCDPAQQAFCDPSLGNEALGPVLKLTGAGWSNFEGVFTQRNNAQRTGANLSETVLNTTNVAAGLNRTRAIDVDGQILAQPLFTTIPGGRNVVYIATMANNVYAVDADSGAIIASRTPLDGRSYRMFDADSGCGGIANPFFGITSTPVIDPTTSTLFLVTKTDDSAPGDPIPHTATFHLHALDLTTLDDVAPPVNIAEQSGIPNITAGSGSPALFHTHLQNNRPGLLFDHGFVYLGFAALPFDDDHWAGFVFSYQYMGGQFTPVAQVALSPNGGAGVWQAGNGLVADPSGNVYFQTGNSATANASSLSDLGEGVVQVTSGTLTFGHAFIAAGSDLLNIEDLDLASSGPFLVPFAGGGTGFRLVAGGKQGLLTVHDPSDVSGALQTIRATFNQYFHIPCLSGQCPGQPCPPGQTCPRGTSARSYYPHIHSNPVVWERTVGGGTETRVYLWGERDMLRALLYDKTAGSFVTQPLDNATFFGKEISGMCDPAANLPCFTAPDVPNTAQHVTPDTSVPGFNGVSHIGPNGMPGGSLSLSANGADPASGIVWVATNTAGDSEAEFVPGILRAYAAAPSGGNLVELWNNKNDAAYFLAKFTPPTVFGGRVYVPANTVELTDHTIPDPSQPFRPASPAGECGSAWATDPLEIHGHIYVYGP
jgi:hypothetical protein